MKSKTTADDRLQHGLEKGGFSYIARIRVPSNRPVHSSYMLTPTTFPKSNAFIRLDATRKLTQIPATDPSPVMHATTPRKIYPVTPKQHTHAHPHLNTPSEEILRNEMTDGPEPSRTPSPHSPRAAACAGTLVREKHIHEKTHDHDTRAVYRQAERKLPQQARLEMLQVPPPPPPQPAPRRAAGTSPAGR